MFVTSGPEVLLPSVADFIDVSLDQYLSSPKLAFFETHILRHFDARLNPELRFTLGAMHVHVHSRLLTREEVEAETGFAKDCWAHVAASISRKLTLELSGRC
jgi:hypothetical protein